MIKCAFDFSGFQRVSEVFNDFYGVLVHFERFSERFSRFQRVSVDFRASQRVSGSFSRFQRVSADFREFQANLDSFSRFQIVLPTICEFWKFATLWADSLILVRHYGSILRHSGSGATFWVDFATFWVKCDILGRLRHSGAVQAVPDLTWDYIIVPVLGRVGSPTALLVNYRLPILSHPDIS